VVDPEGRVDIVKLVLEVTEDLPVSIELPRIVRARWEAMPDYVSGAGGKRIEMLRWFKVVIWMSPSSVIFFMICVSFRRRDTLWRTIYLVGCSIFTFQRGCKRWQMSLLTKRQFVCVKSIRQSVGSHCSLSTRKSFTPFGVPNPVQASQPAPARYRRRCRRS
jgi:hypothetical protein